MARSRRIGTVVIKIHDMIIAAYHGDPMPPGTLGARVFSAADVLICYYCFPLVAPLQLTIRSSLTTLSRETNNLSRGEISLVLRDTVILHHRDVHAIYHFHEIYGTNPDESTKPNSTDNKLPRKTLVNLIWVALMVSKHRVTDKNRR